MCLSVCVCKGVYVCVREGLCRVCVCEGVCVCRVGFTWKGGAP